MVTSRMHPSLQIKFIINVIFVLFLFGDTQNKVTDNRTVDEVAQFSNLLGRFEQKVLQSM